VGGEAVGWGTLAAGVDSSWYWGSWFRDLRL
jgi:hypothetical protein